MRVIISSSAIRGTIRANPSKSHAQRAIALASLSEGISTLSGIGDSDDVLNALEIARKIGADVRRDTNTLVIHGRKHAFKADWHCGESGLCLRMFGAIAPLFPGPVTITGEGTLLHRPVAFIVDALRRMGVTATSTEGSLPLTISGPYQQTSVTMDGSASSQFLTGLLIALPLLGHDTTLTVAHLVSTPYVDLTIETLQSFGIEVRHERHHVFHIPGKQTCKPADLEIQGDWSGMAFLLVAAAISGEIQITGLTYPTKQADGAIIEILQQCGAHVSVASNTIAVRGGTLDAFDFDATHCPDLIPVLAALAVHCNGTSRISGIHRLRTKESDRAKALVEEFAKLNIDIAVDEDTFVITTSNVFAGTVHAHGDHRIAMALAIAALHATGPVEIAGAECVAKSYPAFFNDLISLGAHMTMSHD